MTAAWRHSITLILFFALCAVNTTAQTPISLESIEKKLDADPGAALQALEKLEDALVDGRKLPSRVRYLKGVAHYRLERYGEAEDILSQLLQELTADPGSDKLLISRTALVLGQSLNRLSRPDEGEAALILALRHLPEKAPPVLRADILLARIRTCIYLGQPVNAADLATELLEWTAARQLSEQDLVGRYLLGYAYRNQGKIPEARQHFRRALTQARDLNDRRYEILSLNELGNVLVSEDKMDAALELKKSALAMAREIGDRYLESVCLHDIGNAYNTAGRYSEALEIFREVLGFETTRGNQRAMAMARVNIGYVLFQLGRPEEALTYTRQALKTAREHHLAEVEVPVLKELIRQLEKTGRSSEALDRQKELTALQQRIADRELERKMAEIRDRHRLLDQETEIRILRQDREIRELQMDRQRIVLFSMIGLAVFLALLAVFALAGNRAKRQANRRLEDLNRRLDDLSRTDPLTGLSNRRDFLEKVRLLKSRADRGNSDLFLLMIDLDHFKGVNDHRGHENGDRVLQKVAGILDDRLRGQDLLARWGGEEFLAALADTDRQGARQAAEQLRESVAEAGLDSGLPDHPVTVTIGLARYESGEELQTAITRADDRLYAGKKKGRNRVEA